MKNVKIHKELNPQKILSKLEYPLDPFSIITVEKISKSTKVIYIVYSKYCQWNFGLDNPDRINISHI